MAVVSIHECDPWVVARWAFRLLLERTAERLDADLDRHACEQAVALDGVHFDLLSADQAARVALAMARAAAELREELLKSVGDPRDVEFAESLSLLIVSLRHYPPLDE